MLVVTALVLLRTFPFFLEFEEPYLVGLGATMNGIAFTFEPWNGQLAITQAAYLLPFPEPTTHIVAALLIGLVAGFLASRAMVPAIPDRAVRVLFGLSLAVLPTTDPGPYIGPLNAQWFIALGLTGMALVPVRRWHPAAIVAGGLTGIAPCLAVPVFRDRRGLVLAGVALVQLTVLVSSSRRPLSDPDPAYLWVMLAAAAAMAVARLPARTRIAFAYIALADLAIGAYSGGSLAWNGRHLAVPFAVIGLAIASAAVPVARRAAARVPRSMPATTSL